MSNLYPILKTIRIIPINVAEEVMSGAEAERPRNSFKGYIRTN